MAEGDKGLQVPKQEAGFLFKTEMFFNNVALGYWKHIAVAVVLILGTVLVYGIWQNTSRDAQRGTTAQTAKVLEEVADLFMKDEVVLPGFGGQGGQRISDVQQFVVSHRLSGPDLLANRASWPQEWLAVLTPDVANTEGAADKLKELGARLDGIGANGSGLASAEAYLYAAELYRLAEAPDARRASLMAAEPNADGPLAWSVASGLSQVDQEQGKLDAAEARYRKWMADPEADLAGEHAALDLAAMFEDAERLEDARKVYKEFETRWPSSRLVAIAKMRLKEAGGQPEPEVPLPGGLDDLDAPTDDGAASSAPGEDGEG